MNERAAPDSIHLPLGTYFLGALGAAEAREFERHLEACAECRRELVSFAPLSSMLEALPAPAARSLFGHDSFAPAGAPIDKLAPGDAPDPTEELLLRLRAQRRNRRITLGSVAAAGIAASLAGGASVAPLLQDAVPSDVRYEVISDAGHRVDLGLNSKAWGTELQFSGTELPTSGTLSLWVVDRMGRADRACAWSATKSGRARLGGTVPTDLELISAVQLRDVDSQILAELNLPGGPLTPPS